MRGVYVCVGFGWEGYCVKEVRTNLRGGATQVLVHTYRSMCACVWRGGGLEDISRCLVADVNDKGSFMGVHVVSNILLLTG